MESVVRRGLWLLPLAGILTFLPWLNFIDFGSNGQHVARDEALSAASTGDAVATVAYIAGFFCLMFGLMAANGLALTRRQEFVAVAAIVMDVVAITLLLGVQIGVTALARPIASAYFLAGHQDVGPVVLQLSGGSFDPRILTFVFATMAVAAVGAVITAVCIVRSRCLPTLAAVLLVAGFALVMTDFPAICWVGSALLLGAGGWISWRANRSTARSATGATAGQTA